MMHKLLLATAVLIALPIASFAAEPPTAPSAKPPVVKPAKAAPAKSKPAPVAAVKKPAAPVTPPAPPAKVATAGSVAACQALRDEKAYGKKYDSYLYMVEGKNGWVFRSQADFINQFKVTPKGLATFKTLSDDLKKRGIDLVIAYIPLRGMASPAVLPTNDPLVKGYDINAARKAYADYLVNVNKLGLHIVGTPAMKAGENYFYKADQHWSTQGAHEMAEAVAAYVKTLPSYKGIKQTAFKTTVKQQTSFDGTFNEALKGMCNLTMPPEKGVETVTTAEGGVSGLSLFGKQDSPSVVLVGTSNSKKDQNDANFEGALKETLSTDVYNAAITGGGLDDSMVAYLSSPEFAQHPPKILIWEMPAYYNLEGDQAKKTLRQIIPIAYGVCKTPLAESGDIKITEEKPILIKGLAPKKLVAENVYAYLKFKEPVKKNFSLTFFNGSNTKQSIRFSRSRLYPYSGGYFYSPKSQMTIDSVSLRLPKEMIGFTANVRLCAEPK